MPPLAVVVRWPCTLLGDACHPTLLFLVQGATMAIEDGMVLARAMKTHGADIPAGLLAYEPTRKAGAAQMGLGRNDGRSVEAAPDFLMENGPTLVPAPRRVRTTARYREPRHRTGRLAARSRKHRMPPRQWTEIRRAVSGRRQLGGAAPSKTTRGGWQLVDHALQRLRRAQHRCDRVVA
jgi:hypothetical protein